MKKIVFLLIASMVICGCTGGGDTTEYETEEGTIKVSEGSGGPDWCQEGAGFEMALAGTGDTESMRFEGLVGSGKYAGLCHVFVERTIPEGDERIDYYFDEEFSDIIIVHAINGEVTFSGSLNDFMAGMVAELGMEMPEN